MEDIKNINSCVMIAANLSTPVLLNCVFDSGDLKDTGIEYDSHVTLLYAKDKKLGDSEIISCVRGVNTPMLDESNIIDYLEKHKSQSEFSIPIFDLFELDCFKNDSDYIILKLKTDNSWYEIFKNLNKELSEKFSIRSDFNTYTPHVTLAELEKGTAKKYMGSENLKLILNDSTIHFEDLILSYGETGVSEFKVYDLTTYNSVDRFFRIRQQKRDAVELEKG